MNENFGPGPAHLFKINLLVTMFPWLVTLSTQLLVA